MVMGLSLTVNATALRINEIMYDPESNENYNEWIEIYNEGDQPLDLSNYTLCGKVLLGGFIDRTETVNNDQGLVLDPGAYALITDGGSGTEVYDTYDVDTAARALHVNAASICGGLANHGETITLIDSAQTVTEEVSYADNAEPGFSLEWNNDAFASSAEVDGTPGQENSEGAPPDDPPGNDDNTDPPDDDTDDEPDEEEDEEEEPERTPRSFVPLNEKEILVSETPREEERIILSAPQKETTSPAYITPEGRVRQAVIYAFSGFCIILALLIAFRRV